MKKQHDSKKLGQNTGCVLLNKAKLKQLQHPIISDDLLDSKLKYQTVNIVLVEALGMKTCTALGDCLPHLW